MMSLQLLLGKLMSFLKSRTVALFIGAENNIEKAVSERRKWRRRFNHITLVTDWGTRYSR